MNRKNKIKKSNEIHYGETSPRGNESKFYFIRKKKRESFNLYKDKKIKIYKIITFKQKTFN